ncbi:MAG: TetR family transcriptional regulator [Actinomycetales bacterium]|nr:MAG: TetR family transcriptional regulator [Actinomycetales bacterium]
MADRRTEIADAGVRILATSGARALTHLNVDRELGLADGSTSYYARTRRDLIALIVDRLGTRRMEDLSMLRADGTPTARDAARMLVAGLDATMKRADEHRARLVLLLECQHDPELSHTLATRPPVRESFTQAAKDLLRALGSASPEAHARDLVGLVDALVMQRIIRTAVVDEHAIIAAYLTGVLSAGADAPAVS